jgi:hypothetical protein
MSEIPDNYSSEKIEKSSEVSRLNNSAELVCNPIKDGELGFDKVYIQADSVTNDGSKWVVHIDSQDSTVVLNEGLKAEYGLDSSAVVNDLRNGNGEKKLISGGTWVWIRDNDGNEFLSLMRRDEGAPNDAGCLTGPAGRCGEKLSQTSVDETNQEFIFVKSSIDNKNKLLAFYRNEEDKNEVLDQKMRQIGEIYRVLMENYEKTGNEQSKVDAEFLRDNIKSKEDIQLFKMSENSSDGLDTVVMKIDGEEVDRVKGVAYMDEKNHTLEVREEVVIDLPEGSKISKVLDGERWMRPIVLVKKEELKGLLDDKLVSALRNYIEKVV